MKLLDRLAAAHARTGAPGTPVDLLKDGRYVVEIPREGRLPQRRAFRYEKVDLERVRVWPRWTTHDGPEGKAVQHRKCATE